LSAQFRSAIRLYALWTIRLFAILAACAVCATAQTKPMALNQAKYEIQAGAPVPLSASSDTVDFVLKATKVSVIPAIGLVVGPDRAGNQVMVAASVRAKPGEYAVTLSATSATGEQRQAAMDIVVKPRVTVPSNATRAPVVLLNGWETLYTNACPVSTDSTETFGNLAQYLTSDGVPVVYFFDNCAEDPNQPIENLAQDLATFLGTIKYDNGSQVPQIDLVAFSLGGLVARAYLAGLQPNQTLTPPATTLIRDLVLIAVPNYGSYLAANYASSIIGGTQSAELIPASAFLWNLATWNQHGDDLRGVNAIAVIGNAGTYVNNLTGATLANASDGLVSTTSASLGFVAQNPAVTEIVPYCQVDASAFTNVNIAYDCTNPGIANVTDESQYTSEIVRSFLAGSTTWQTVATTPATDPYLSVDGGAFFALLNMTGAYVTDLTQVIWGTLTLIGGEDAGTIFYNDFVAGSGMYEVTSASLGTIDCNEVTEVVGYVAPERCKLATAIVSIGPLESTAARQVSPGSAITINGEEFGTLCNGCKVVATSAGSTSGQSLSVSYWNDTTITAQLPASLSGLVNISVDGTLGNDSINIMVGSGGPAITGVTNAGSFQSGFAPATWVSIFGTGLASTTYTWQASDFTDGKLPTSLQGVSVTINGDPAYVEYISPTQINVLVPDSTTVGSVPVQVTASEQVSNSTTAQQQQFSPSFFTVGGTFVAAVHANNALVSTSSPAAPGEEIVLYGTGFGPTNPASPTGQLVTAPAALANSVQFTIGGVTLSASSVEFAGLVEAGLYQFNVTVPASLKSGNAAVVATIGGVQTQSGVSIPVN
jgi:uncharacterized protein (TIGR03437 family)